MNQEEKNENNQENKPKEESKESNEDDKCQILPSDYAGYDYNYKIIIIGNSGVGKTCLTYRATSGLFQDKMSPTLGLEYSPFVLRYKEKVLKLEIWDTCGQEAYRSLIKSLFMPLMKRILLILLMNGLDNAKHHAVQKLNFF